MKFGISVKRHAKCSLPSAKAAASVCQYALRDLLVFGAFLCFKKSLEVARATLESILPVAPEFSHFVKDIDIGRHDLLILVIEGVVQLPELDKVGLGRRSAKLVCEGRIGYQAATEHHRVGATPESTRERFVICTAEDISVINERAFAVLECIGEAGICSARMHRRNIRVAARPYRSRFLSWGGR